MLLKIIKEEGNIKKLKYFGLTYRQIGELIEINITNGNLNSNEDNISLSEQGQEFLDNNKDLIKERDKAKWIEVDWKNKIRQIHKDDIFLPSRKELSFLK